MVHCGGRGGTAPHRSDRIFSAFKDLVFENVSFSASIKCNLCVNSTSICRWITENLECGWDLNYYYVVPVCRYMYWTYPVTIIAGM